MIFFPSDRNKADDSIRYIDQAKYEDNLLVWVVISPSGISHCYIVPSKMAANQKVYLEECLIKPQMLQMYQKYVQLKFLRISQTKCVQGYLASKKFR